MTPPLDTGTDPRPATGAMHDDAIDRAKVRGHAVEYDGPTLGGADRWTCIRCGRAILKAGGPFYGSAKDEECAR